MDVVVFAVLLVGLAAFVAAPLYRQTSAVHDVEGIDAAEEAAARALDDMEVDRASGLIDPD